MPPSFSGGLLCAHAADAATASTAARTPERTRFMETSHQRAALFAASIVAAIMPQAVGCGKPRLDRAHAIFPLSGMPLMRSWHRVLIDDHDEPSLRVPRDNAALWNPAHRR